MREELLREVWGLTGRRARARSTRTHSGFERSSRPPSPAGRLVINVWGVGYRLLRQRGQTVSAPDQVTDLYRELARHRVEEAIDRLGRAPLDRLVAQAAEVLEEAAGALACMTALYATPGGRSTSAGRSRSTS